jgi:hypothetical protein
MPAHSGNMAHNLPETLMGINYYIPLHYPGNMPIYGMTITMGTFGGVL